MLRPKNGRAALPPGLFFLIVLSTSLPASAMTHTWLHRAPVDAASLKLEGLIPLPLSQGLLKAAVGQGSAESQALESAEPFDDLVVSWNADLPAGASLVVEAQVRGPEGWGRWYRMAAVEEGRFFSPPAQEDEQGKVDVDTLKLKAPATAARWRLKLVAGGRKPAVVRLVAVTVSSKPGAEPPTPFRAGPWVRDLKVPARSQMEEQEKYKHDVCSPTSLAAVMQFHGRRLETADVAELVRDQSTQIFGDWPFNVAVAARHGLEGFVSRLGSLADLEAEVAEGRPVVVSVTFGAGELSGAPISKTKGHVMVVTGFTETGDVIAMDPAGPDKAGTRRVYKRDEFHRAWRLNKRGLAYLLGKPLSRRLWVGVPAADLQAVPRRRAKLSLDDPDHKSQLLYGEAVRPIEVKGDWVRVNAEEQLDFLEGGRWQGYPGWVSASALSASPPAAPDVVVRTRQALLHRGEKITAVSVGTRLRLLGREGPMSRVLLGDGSVAEVLSDNLRPAAPPPADEARSLVVKTAELFLGTSYYWGGRSGVQPDSSIGVDCSGLVSLAYRAAGLDVPRDAHEQRLMAAAAEPSRLRPGDLVFLTDKAGSDNVVHVMIFTGGDGLIESRQAGGRAVRTTFTERFGEALSSLKDGAEVQDLTEAKPRTRTVFFGTFF